MRSANVIQFFFTAALIGMAGCKKPYAPSITESTTNYLVVEGVINSGQDSTIIKLSRTVNLSVKTAVNPELNAIVVVEDDQNGSYSLSGIGNGKYGAPNLNLDNTRKFRLRIKTSDGREYLSDPEAVKSTPPIDSIGFVTQANGINIYANTHDAGNNTRYYRWDYQETWLFHAKYQSQFITDGKELVLRTQAQQIWTCFGNAASTSIVLGSSAKLQQDVIYQNPVTQVASTEEKLEARYSILVNQYALTKEAFDFWQNLQKNTEHLGSIFDPQPSNLRGNIHCSTNPSEPVIGYVSVTNVQKKRIFIDNDQLPVNWRTVYPYNCGMDSNLFCRQQGLGCLDEVAANLIPTGSSQIPLNQIPAPHGPGVIGFFGASIECADCTIRGTTKQPSFWK